MCGFFITNRLNINDEQKLCIQKGIDFRGPDSQSGFVEHNGWFSYHSRLAIIGLQSATPQPVCNNDGSILVFNGEILNYRDIGLDKFNKNYTSDTDLLNDLLKNNLLDLNELDGFFSFVFIGPDGNLKTAARDALGVKPLFYHKDEQYITFCSEPAVIGKIYNLPVSEEAITEYKLFRAPIFKGSFFEGVQAINPGCCYLAGEYFSYNNFLSISETNNNDLFKALDKGIKTRLISDAKVGLLISRGVDSNLVKHISKLSDTYSIGMDKDEEIEYLKNDPHFKNTIIKIASIDEFREAFEYLLEIRGEPLSVPNEVLLYLIAKKAKEDGIKVLLSGEGADEFFGGYDRIFSWAKSCTKFDVDTFISLYCYGHIEKNSKVYEYIKHLFNNNKINNAFEQVRWFFIKFHLPVLFRRLDFSLMAAGVEGREPIANLHVLKCALGLKGSDLIDNKLGKIPLRNILRNYTSHEFAYMKKIGFPVNLCDVYPDLNMENSYEIWFRKNLEILK